MSSEFQTQILPQRQGRFSNASQRRAPIGRLVKINKKQTLNLFIGVPILPVSKKIQVSFLTQLPERKENAQGFHHEANGDFKTVRV